MFHIYNVIIIKELYEHKRKVAIISLIEFDNQ